MKTVFTLNLRYPIRVTQHREKTFRVTYGQQVRDHLTYAEAAWALGECILHALACEGKIDNSGL